jgi:hypothetical protein
MNGIFSATLTGLSFLMLGLALSSRSPSRHGQRHIIISGHTSSISAERSGDLATSGQFRTGITRSIFLLR